MTMRCLLRAMRGATLMLALAACGGSGDNRQPDRLNRPLFVGVDPLGNKLTYILDAERTSVFAWNGEKRTYITGRAPGPANPKRFIALPVGTNSVLRKRDVLFTGFAVNATGSALAALYSFGFEDRVGHLTIVPLEPFPVDPATNLNYRFDAGAVGPFATPEGRFLVGFPLSATESQWRFFPEPASMFTAPNLARMVWNAEGTRLYAADRVNEQIHVFEWPSMAPITSVTLPGRPLDLDVRPETEQLAVVTSTALYQFGALPTLPVEQSVPQASLPIRVLYDRHEAGALLAVLNQNTTLSFYETDTLCQIDADEVGFQAANLQFIDTGAPSNPTIEGIGASGCASFVADQTWEVTFEGVAARGSAAVSSPTAVTFTASTEFIQVGDPIFVGEFASTITAVEPSHLFFEPVSQVLPFGQQVTIEVLAANAWTVAGSQSGIIGRAETDAPFTGVIRFQIAGQGAAPTRGDQFLFRSLNNVSPVFLGGAPSDLAQDPFGRFIVPIPQNGLVRAVDVRRSDERWIIQFLYTIP